MKTLRRIEQATLSFLERALQTIQLWTGVDNFAWVKAIMACEFAVILYAYFNHGILSKWVSGEGFWWAMIFLTTKFFSINGKRRSVGVDLFRGKTSHLKLHYKRYRISCVVAAVIFIPLVFLGETRTIAIFMLLYVLEIFTLSCAPLARNQHRIFA